MGSVRFRSACAALGLAGAVLAVLTPAPATAVSTAGVTAVSTDGRAPSPATTGGRQVVSVEWMDSVPADPFGYPPGEVCPFATRVSFPVNEQRGIRTRYSDGSSTEFITGRLRGRYTNVETGRTVERELSGDGVLEYRPDGGLLISVIGGAGLGFHFDDNPPGVLQVNGPRSAVVVDIPAGGPNTRLLQRGPYEDLCRTLR
jgi:hypothetical protein